MTMFIMLLSPSQSKIAIYYYYSAQADAHFTISWLYGFYHPKAAYCSGCCDNTCQWPLTP